jgi:DnaJ-class molecular chaperone
MIDFSFASSLDCYFVLRLTPDATHEEIDAAYVKALASLPARGFVRRLECFWFGISLDTIRDAYRTLADPASREKYDAWRKKFAFGFFPPC